MLARWIDCIYLNMMQVRLPPDEVMQIRSHSLIAHSHLALTCFDPYQDNVSGY